MGPLYLSVATDSRNQAVDFGALVRRKYQSRQLQIILPVNISKNKSLVDIEYRQMRCLLAYATLKFEMLTMLRVVSVIREYANKEGAIKIIE
jgi:hypothetical protein